MHHYFRHHRPVRDPDVIDAQTLRAMDRHAIEWQRTERARARVGELRTLHHVAVTPVPWEAMRDAPEPRRVADDAAPYRDVVGSVDAAFEAQHAEWASRHALAIDVLGRDVTAYERALAACRAWETLSQWLVADGLRVALAESTASIDLLAPSGWAVPMLPPSHAGALPAVEHLDAYQDHLCALALRAAREALAILPIDDAVIDVWVARATMDRPADAEPVPVRVLSVICPRAALDAMDWARCDASDVIALLAHEMRFDPQRGFDEVPRITRS